MSTVNKILTLSAEDKSDTDKQTISLFIAGIGAIGSTLLRQIGNVDNLRFLFSILGACNSKVIAWQPDIRNIEEEIALSSERSDMDAIIEELIQYNDGKLIFVDATGNEEVARHYLKLLENGIHIVTPSKRANTFSQEYFNQLQELSSRGGVHYRYETSVGAGLPVIGTIQSLIDSGDEITEISGVVSGTMTYIFNQLQHGIEFSRIVKKARLDGYSEPDPRDDLSGEDVARKFLILARTSGHIFEREQIQVESLVPEELIELNIDDFLGNLPSYDEHWKRKNTQAMVNNKRLRYTGQFSKDGIIIGIKEVAADSPLGSLKGTDNLIEIYTKRYAASPIVIQGPGAGREVTAAGVLADIAAIAKYLS